MHCIALSALTNSREVFTFTNRSATLVSALAATPARAACFVRLRTALAREKPDVLVKDTARTMVHTTHDFKK